MLGKDLQTKEKGTIIVEGIQEIEDGKKFQLKLTTALGDAVEMIFYSKKKAEYAKVAEKFWTTIITQYTLLSNRLVYLEPKIYWTLYKRLQYGKEFLLLTGAKMWINEQEYSFPDTKFYFTPQESYDKGVYGIYYKGELLYIGSASDMLARWREHDSNFRSGSSSSPLYQIGYNPDEIEYEVLVKEEDCPVEKPSMWVFELIEWSYIQVLQPKWNRDKGKYFSFQARQGDLPVSYQSLIPYIFNGDYKLRDFQISKEAEEKLEEMNEWFKKTVVEDKDWVKEE